MRRVDLGNVLALLLALGLGAVLVYGDEARPEPVASESSELVQDATGHRVRARRYERIVSASSIADQVLLRIAEPTRVAGVTGHTQRRGPEAWRFDGFEAVENLDRLEHVIALDPDLVIVSNVMDSRRTARLREAGLRVFDIGPMRGVATFVPSIHQLGELIGERERAAIVARTFETRLATVAPDVEPVDGLYLGIVGGSLYGGTRGTNYHDVLSAAGMHDVAAAAGYEGWPVLNNETLLQLDPPWIVTPAGRDELCRFTGLERLGACRSGQIIEIEEGILGDPGFGMLDAAEALRDALAPHR